MENQSARYKWPHDEISASRDLRKIRELQTDALKNGKDPSKIIEKFSNSNGVYEILSSVDLINILKTKDEYSDLVEKYNISSYGYFVYSTSVWDQINDSKAQLRKGYRVLKGGLQLSNNGMVQGDMITIPLTKSIGHQNQAHIVIHFEGADPDLGRKGFQPELRDLAERIAVIMVRRLTDRRSLLKNDSGAKPEIEKQKAIHEWVRDQEKHEEEFPLVLKNKNFFLPTKKISIQSVPVSEQDVIVLFNQLIAGGVIRGIRLLATSQTAQYDGIFRFISEEPLENIIFNKDSNPLGIEEEQCTKVYLGPPQILEYKFSLDGLIHEFESEIKDEKDINLAIFWDMGSEYKRNYNIISLIDLENVHQRHHHGITHIIKSNTSRFYAICLKELIDFLNDIDGCQSFQQSQYGIDI
ncbi:hypothetical protein F1542_03330 [Komagataeibacter sp. FXV3]|nr:hypothetical protein [Komagataeibacter sp. FXV3]